MECHSQNKRGEIVSLSISNVDESTTGSIGKVIVTSFDAHGYRQSVIASSGDIEPPE